MQVRASSNWYSARILAPTVNAEKHNPTETTRSTATRLMRDFQDLGVEVSPTTALRSSYALGNMATTT
jgi:hypothetical protein